MLPIRHASYLGLSHASSILTPVTAPVTTTRYVNMLKRYLAVLALGWTVGTATAQLAITETLSSAATNLNAEAVVAGPDFWELSNFGPDAIDLTGYRFNDADATLGGDANSTVFNGITIAPGEAILFVQSGNLVVTNRDSFIEWWGDTNLPANVQVIFYTGNGLAEEGDSLVLWDNLATDDADYLDRADFAAAVRGHSFTYDTNGVHGLPSTNGLARAFKAATSDDEGSPGTNAGPVALAITQHPTPATLTSPASYDVTYSVAAQGLPRPRYQWRCNGIPIPGAVRPSLTLTNLQLTNAGTYSVVVSNGLQTLTSSNAVLTVTANPAEPGFGARPKDAAAFEGQTVQLAATVTGSPTPALQWQLEGTNLVGETGAALLLFNVQSNQAGVYTLVAASSAGTNSVSATVTVTAKPRLLITEVHSSGSNGNEDWWELTSCETYPINLKGWRWDDSSPSLVPNNAFAFTNDVLIHPGESICFVEKYSAAQFRSWWGLPPSVQVVSYGGGGLGLSSTSGDQVNVWNAVTLAGNELPERIAGVTFASALNGVTLVFDPENPPVGGVMAVRATNTVSGVGANGVFTSTNGAFGSPGRVVAPVFVTITVGGNETLLSWNAVNARSYTVEAAGGLNPPQWNAISNLTATSESAVIGDALTASNRFYRVGTVIPFVPQP
jgi:hypothetical protein